MGHDHSTDHGAGANIRRLSLVLGITSAVLIAEVVGAVVSNSLALLADAGHMLTDVAGLTMALVAASLMRKPATDTRTWGFLRAESVAAAAQAVLLFGVGIYVLYEAISRLVDPPSVAPGQVVVFGAIGLIGNAVGIWLLSTARHDNLNMRAAYLEVLNDTFGSIAVLASAAVNWATGWQRADAVASLLIVALIVPRTVSLLRASLRVLMESTPRDLDLGAVRDHILATPYVLSLHDLHASQVSTALPILSVHVVLADEAFEHGRLKVALRQLQSCLAGHFDVEHSTIQFESVEHASLERRPCTPGDVAHDH